MLVPPHAVAAFFLTTLRAAPLGAILDKIFASQEGRDLAQRGAGLEQLGLELSETVHALTARGELDRDGDLQMGARHFVYLSQFREEGVAATPSSPASLVSTPAPASAPAGTPVGARRP